MRITIMTVVIAALATPGALAQDRKLVTYRVPVLLEIAARGYTAGDREASMAGDSAPDNVESYVWTDRTLCSMGSGSAPPQEVPWAGWHVTGTMDASTGTGGNQVRVEWQRIWDNGARVTVPKGVADTPVRAGERIELDRLTTTTVGGCGTAQIRLEAGVITKPVYRLGVVGSATGVAAGARRGAGSGGTGVGTGTGGRGAGGGGAGTGSGATGAGGVSAGARGQANAQLQAADALRTQAESLRFQLKARLAVPYDALLWLVHRKPDGTEVVHEQTVRFQGLDQAFTFPSIVVPTAKGDITLEISGTLRAGTPENRLGLLSYYVQRSPPAPGATATPTYTYSASPGAVGLSVSIARRARAAGPPPLDTRGGSYFFMDIPAPTDVLSFEFPALQKATEDLLNGHTFSLRIKVTPVAK